MGQTALLPLRRKVCFIFFRPKNPTASAGFEPAILDVGNRMGGITYNVWLRDLCAGLSWIHRNHDKRVQAVKSQRPFADQQTGRWAESHFVNAPIRKYVVENEHLSVDISVCWRSYLSLSSEGIVQEYQFCENTPFLITRKQTERRQSAVIRQILCNTKQSVYKT
jgi:hypothetical protein